MITVFGQSGGERYHGEETKAYFSEEKGGTEEKCGAKEKSRTQEKSEGCQKTSAQEIDAQGKTGAGC